MTPSEALREAIRLVGMTEMARRTGVTVQAVWQWNNRRKHAPADRVLQIEKAAGRKITRHDLRPDLYPEPHREDAA